MSSVHSSLSFPPRHCPTDTAGRTDHGEPTLGRDEAIKREMGQVYDLFVQSDWDPRVLARCANGGEALNRLLQAFGRKRGIPPTNAQECVWACITSGKPLPGSLLGTIAKDERIAGHHAVTWAVALGRLDALAQLLDAGYNPNACDALGNTGLHWAVMTQNTRASQLLRARRADPDVQNCFFGTPADYRCESETPNDAVLCEAEIDGNIVAWRAADLHKHLGLTYLSQSRYSSESLVRLALLLELDVDISALRAEITKRDDLPSRLPTLRLKQFPEMGWGVCPVEDLPRNTFVGTYTGKITLQAYCKSRTYLASPLRDPKTQLTYENLRLSIDGQQEGNLCGRINSSHLEGWDNLQVELGWRRGRPVMDMYTWRAVPAGEQLLWFYGKDYLDHADFTPRPVGQSPYGSEMARFDFARKVTRQLKCKGFAADLKTTTMDELLGPRGITKTRQSAGNAPVMWIFRNADWAKEPHKLTRLLLCRGQPGQPMQRLDGVFLTFTDAAKVYPRLLHLDLLERAGIECGLSQIH